MVCPYRINKEKFIKREAMQFPENTFLCQIIETETFGECAYAECPFFDEVIKDCKKAIKERR